MLLLDYPNTRLSHVYTGSAYSTHMLLVRWMKGDVDLRWIFTRSQTLDLSE